MFYSQRQVRNYYAFTIYLLCIYHAFTMYSLCIYLKGRDRGPINASRPPNKPSQSENRGFGTGLYGSRGVRTPGGGCRPRERHHLSAISPLPDIAPFVPPSLYNFVPIPPPLGCGGGPRDPPRRSGFDLHPRAGRRRSHRRNTRPAGTGSSGLGLSNRLLFAGPGAKIEGR